MDEAGAAVGGDEIAREEGAGAGVEFQRAFPILVIPAFAGMTKVVVDRVAGDGAGEVGAFEGLEVEASRIAFVANLCLKIGRETAHEGTDTGPGKESTHTQHIPPPGAVQI